MNSEQNECAELARTGIAKQDWGAHLEDFKFDSTPELLQTRQQGRVFVSDQCWQVDWVWRDKFEVSWPHEDPVLLLFFVLVGGTLMWLIKSLNAGVALVSSMDEAGHNASERDRSGVLSLS